MSEILTNDVFDVKAPFWSGPDLPTGNYCAHSLGGLQSEGMVAAVRYSAIVPDSVWAQVPALEREEAFKVGVARTPSFVAGRIALRHALAGCGREVPEGIEVDPAGAPAIPHG